MVIEIEGFYYSLPDNWSDLTIEDFIELNNTAKEAPKDDAPEAEKFLFYLEFISCFGIPKEHLRSVKLYDVDKNGLGLVNLFNHLWQFTQLPEEAVFNDFERFYLNKCMYQFNTNTISPSGSTRAMSDYTFEEYEEANGVLTAMNHLKEGQLEKLPLLCAIFFRPVKKKYFQMFRSYEIEAYDIDKVNARAELFKNELGMDKVWSCYFFLLRRMMNLDDFTANSLREALEKQQI